MTGTLADLLRETATTRPELSLTVDDTARDLGTLAAAAEEVASRLHSAGLQPGARVVLLAPNGHEFLVSWMAAQLAGLETAVVNTSYPDELLGEMFAVLRPEALLLSREHAGRQLSGPRLDISDVVQGRLHELGGALIPLGGAPAGHTRPADSIAGFMHTSGTTGVPKFCAQSHRYYLSLGRFVSHLFGLTAEDSVFSPLPLFHVNPLGYGLMGALSGGADFHTAERFSVTGYWPKVVRDGVTVLILHGAPISLLNRHADAEGAAGHAVRASFFGDQEFLARFGVPRSVSAYGSTEAGGITHTRWWRLGESCAEPEGQMRCAGVPRPGVEWRLQDGEILVRAAEHELLLSGYVTADGLVDPRDDDGWFHTGDLGRRTGDGELVFIERASESVRVKGEYVPLEYLEGVVSAVLDVPIIAWKRVVDGEEQLVLYAEGPVDLARYRAVEEDLPRFMRPAAFAEVAALPRDAGLGKVQRRRLSEVPVVRWSETSSAR